MTSITLLNNKTIFASKLTKQAAQSICKLASYTAESTKAAIAVLICTPKIVPKHWYL